MALYGLPWSHINIEGPPQSTLISKKGKVRIEKNEEKSKMKNEQRYKGD